MAKKTVSTPPVPAQPKMTRYEKSNLFLTIGGLILAIAGFGITMSKINENDEINRKQNSVNEIYKIKNKEYLNTLSRLHIVAATTSAADTVFKCATISQLYETDNCYKATNLFLNDVSYAFNLFENMSNFYKNDLVDRGIMRNSICEEVDEFVYILNKLSPVLNSRYGDYVSRLPMEDIRYLINACGSDTTKLNIN